MNAQTEQVDDLRLVALPTAVSVADMFVRFSLGEWRLRAMQDEAAQTIRRLVGAAVDVADRRAPGFLLVRLRLTGTYLVVEVEGNRSRCRRSWPAPVRAWSTSPRVAAWRGASWPCRAAWTPRPCPCRAVNLAAHPLPRRWATSRTWTRK